MDYTPSEVVNKAYSGNTMNTLRYYLSDPNVLDGALTEVIHRAIVDYKVEEDVKLSRNLSGPIELELNLDKFENLLSKGMRGENLTLEDLTDVSANDLSLDMFANIDASQTTASQTNYSTNKDITYLNNALNFIQTLPEIEKLEFDTVVNTIFDKILNNRQLYEDKVLARIADLENPPTANHIKHIENNMVHDVVYSILNYTTKNYDVPVEGLFNFKFISK